MMILGEEQKCLKYFRRSGEICNIGGFLFATNNTRIFSVAQQMRQNPRHHHKATKSS